MGISVNEDKSHLIGAINVDTSAGHLCPFLKYFVEKISETPYPLMEHNGDSYSYRQMFVDDGSLSYLEEDLPDEETLKPLYERFNTALIPPLKDSLEIN